MNLPPSIQLDRPRRRRKRHLVASAPTPPGPVDRVVSVVIDGTNAVIVTTAAEVASIVDPALAMWIRPEGGPFLYAIAWEILTPTQVMFTYEDDVTACTLWQIGDPAAWEWSDSGATVAPFEGSIG